MGYEWNRSTRIFQQWLYLDHHSSSGHWNCNRYCVWKLPHGSHHWWWNRRRRLFIYHGTQQSKSIGLWGQYWKYQSYTYPYSVFGCKYNRSDSGGRLWYNHLNCHEQFTLWNGYKWLSDTWFSRNENKTYLDTPSFWSNRPNSKDWFDLESFYGSDK